MSGARATIVGCSGPDLTTDERAFFRDANPWGFILFQRNVQDADQIRRLTAELRETVGRNAPILIDQEGGRVARLLPPQWSGWDDALPFVQRFAPAARARAMELRYQIIGQELSALGIDVDCAPLADIAQPDTHPVVRTRCYGTEPGEVAELGRAVADGLARGGVLPILKHIPGHGRTSLDSHEKLPVVDQPLDVLEAEDFAPFRALSDLPMAMTAHIVYPALDPDAPATLSPAAITYIRTKIGFDGLLMTDDLSMRALQGSFGDRTTRALTAGCDVILHCNGDMIEMAAISAAAPLLSGDAARRADAALAARTAPENTDPAMLRAELAKLDEVRDAG